MRKSELKGRKFGKLEVKKPLKSDANGRAKWLCKCECGRTIEAYGTDLTAGRKKDCGRCRESKQKDPYSRTRIYWVWNSMKSRCNNPKSSGYSHYGGRGVSVCREWSDSFTAFREWAFAAGYDEEAPRGVCTLDRIDADGNYCPENCRWVNMKKQAENKSPILKSRRDELDFNRMMIHVYGNQSHCHFKWTKPEDYA